MKPEHRELIENCIAGCAKYQREFKDNFPEDYQHPLYQTSLNLQYDYITAVQNIVGDYMECLEFYIMWNDFGKGGRLIGFDNINDCVPVENIDKLIKVIEKGNEYKT